MKMSTSAIQAKYVLGRGQAADYIDWAVVALTEGLDSKNLRILAGLDRFVSPFEAEEYFLKARKELSLPEPTKEEAIRAYAVHIARGLLEPDSDFGTLVRMLSELCSSNDYPKCLMVWYNLDDGLCDIKTGGYPHSFESLYGADPRIVVEKTAREFIQNNG